MSLVINIRIIENDHNLHVALFDINVTISHQ
jgi:hypothetical protein